MYQHVLENDRNHTTILETFISLHKAKVTEKILSFHAFKWHLCPLLQSHHLPMLYHTTFFDHYLMDLAHKCDQVQSGI